MFVIIYILLLTVLFLTYLCAIARIVFERTTYMRVHALL